MKELLGFFIGIEKLKYYPRYTSSSFNKPSIKTPLQDTQASHSWLVAIMADVLIDFLELKLDKDKVHKLSLINPLLRFETGDIDARNIYENKVTATDKRQKEKETINNFIQIFSFSVASDFKEILEEYVDNKTAEARYVKALKKLEAIIHLINVDIKDWDIKEVIPNHADEAVRNFPQLETFLVEVKNRLKEKFIHSGLEWKQEYVTIK